MEKRSVFGISSLFAAAWGRADGAALLRQGIDFSQAAGEPLQAQEISISETVINFIPTNIFDALSKGSIIQIIVLGYFWCCPQSLCAKKPESALYGLIVDLNEVVIAIIRYVMIMAPIGIFALIASTISSLGLQIILPLGSYLLVYGLATVTFSLGCG